METLSIDKNRLQAVLLFAAKQDIRVQLKGVNIASDGDTFRLTASCGHTAASCVHQNWDKLEFNLTIPRDKIELAIKASLKKNPTVTVDIKNHTIDGIPFEPIDVAFPNVARLWPETIDNAPCRLNSQYLERVEKATRLMGYGAFEYSLWTGQRQAIFAIGPDFKGIIMPLTDGVQKPETLPKF